MISTHFLLIIEHLVSLPSGFYFTLTIRLGGICSQAFTIRHDTDYVKTMSHSLYIEELLIIIVSASSFINTFAQFLIKKHMVMIFTHFLIHVLCLS